MASQRNVIALEDGGTRRLVPPYAALPPRSFCIAMLKGVALSDCRSRVVRPLIHANVARDVHKPR